jgi:lipid-A-disaccharide synthase
VVKELIETFSPATIRKELDKILAGEAREQMLEGYAEVSRRLGKQKAPETAARLMIEKLKTKSEI